MTGTLPPEHGVRVNGVVLPVAGRRWRGASRTPGTGPARSSAPTSSIGGSGCRADSTPTTIACTRDPSGAARLEAERRGDIVVDAALDGSAGRGGSRSSRGSTSTIRMRRTSRRRSSSRRRRARLRRRGRVRRRASRRGCSTGCETSGQADRTDRCGHRGSRRRARRSRRADARDARLRHDAARAAGHCRFHLNAGNVNGTVATVSRRETVATPVSLADLAGTLLQAAGSPCRRACGTDRWRQRARRMPRRSIRGPPAGTIWRCSRSTSGS